MVMWEFAALKSEKVRKVAQVIENQSVDGGILQQVLYLV